MEIEREYKKGNLVFSDQFLELYRNDDKVFTYLFKFSNFVKSSKRISVILQYFSWEFPYMSKEALIELLEIATEISLGKITDTNKKYFNKLKKSKNRDEIVTVLWNKILLGEGIPVN